MIKLKEIIFPITIITIIAVCCIFQIISYFNNIYYIWGDDCQTVVSSVFYCNSIKELLTKYCEGNNYLPLFRIYDYVIYSIFGINWYLFKLPSLLSGIASLVLFFYILKNIFKNKLLIVICLIFLSLSHSYIVYSHSTKPYMTELLICLVILYNAIKILKSNKDLTNLDIIKYFCFSLFFFYFSISAIVITELYWFVIFIKKVVEKNTKNVIKLTILQVMLICITSVEYITYIKQIVEFSHLNWQWLNKNDFFFRPDCFDAVISLFNYFYYRSVMFCHETINLIPIPVIVSALVLFFIGTIMFLLPLFKTKKEYYNKYIGLLVILPIYAFILFSFFPKNNMGSWGIYPFCNRAILFLIPFITITLFKVFDMDFKNKYLSYLFNVVLMIIFIFHFIYIYRYDKLKDTIFNNTVSNITLNNLKFIEQLPENAFILAREMEANYCILLKRNIKYMEFDKDKIINEGGKQKIFVTIHELKNLTSKKEIDLYEFIKDNKKIYLIGAIERSDEKIKEYLNEFKYYETEKAEPTFPPYAEYAVFEKKSD